MATRRGTFPNKRRSFSKSEEFVDSDPDNQLNVNIKFGRGKYGTLKLSAEGLGGLSLGDEQSSAVSCITRLVESPAPTKKTPYRKQRDFEPEIEAKAEAKADIEAKTIIDHDDLTVNLVDHSEEPSPSIEMFEVKLDTEPLKPKAKLKQYPSKLPNVIIHDLQQKAPKENQNDVFVRKNRCSEILNDFLESYFWTVLSLLLTLIALFAEDFSYAFLPPSTDQPINYLLLATFCLLFLEIIFSIIATKNYQLSFFFVCDFLGTISLLIDFPFLLDLFGLYTERTTYINLSNGSSGGAEDSVETALQVASYARIVRIVRIVRVVRLFKFFSKSQRNTLKSQKVDPSKAGLRLADMVSKKLYVVVLILLIVSPFIDFNSINTYDSRAMVLKMLNETKYSPEFTTLLEHFKKYNTDLVDLVFDGVISYSKSPDGLRAWDIMVYSISTTTYASFSQRDVLYGHAGQSLILTLLVIALFGVSTLLINRDAHTELVKPIEKITKMMTKLATTICMMDKDGGTASEMKMNVASVSNILIAKMANIFHVAPPDTNSDDTTSDSISKNQSRIVSADASVINSEAQSGASTPGLPSEDLQVDESTVVYSPQLDPELQSVRSILQSPMAVSAFKLFLRTNMREENILFYMDSLKYRDFVINFADMIYESYISVDAPNLVNISALMTRNIESEIERPGSEIFIEAQTEVLNLMEYVHHDFMVSPFCHNYLVSKRKQGNVIPPPVVAAERRLSVVTVATRADSNRAESPDSEIDSDFDDDIQFAPSIVPPPDEKSYSPRDLGFIDEESSKPPNARFPSRDWTNNVAPPPVTRSNSPPIIDFSDDEMEKALNQHVSDSDLTDSEIDIPPEAPVDDEDDFV